MFYLNTQKVRFVVQIKLEKRKRFVLFLTENIAILQYCNQERLIFKYSLITAVGSTPCPNVEDRMSS